MADRKIVLGVNHEMHDFRTGRKKKLDLVIARPEDPGRLNSGTLVDLADKWDIPLDANQASQLASLPEAFVGEVGSVLVAVEAKACMTAHVKALPRLYDEMNSSHLTVHGASSQALAVGFAMVNCSTAFVSPKLNKHNLRTSPAEVTPISQPNAAERTITKLSEIPRRSGRAGEEGFDALGIVLVDLKNDGSPAELAVSPPAPELDNAYEYRQMINRVVNEYEAAFAHI